MGKKRSKNVPPPRKPGGVVIAFSADQLPCGSFKSKEQKKKGRAKGGPMVKLKKIIARCTVKSLIAEGTGQLASPRKKQQKNQQANVGKEKTGRKQQKVKSGKPKKGISRQQQNGSKRGLFRCRMSWWAAAGGGVGLGHQKQADRGGC